jgi:hypothetical protein
MSQRPLLLERPLICPGHEDEVSGECEKHMEMAPGGLSWKKKGPFHLYGRINRILVLEKLLLNT